MMEIGGRDSSCVVAVCDDATNSTYSTNRDIVWGTALGLCRSMPSEIMDGPTIAAILQNARSSPIIRQAKRGDVAMTGPVGEVSTLSRSVAIGGHSTVPVLVPSWFIRSIPAPYKAVTRSCIRAIEEKGSLVGLTADMGTGKTVSMVLSLLAIAATDFFFSATILMKTQQDVNSIFLSVTGRLPILSDDYRSNQGEYEEWVNAQLQKEISS
jgi:hypothetical protein